MDDDKKITYFAATNTRGKRELFGIRGLDRGKHMYVIGKTGMGKSTMLENLAIQDIQNGNGIAFIDPHGSTAEKLLDFVPFDRIDDVVYFAPFDTEVPVGFNVMEDVGFDKRHLVVSGLMGAFKRIWVDAWSARMEYILQNTLLALLEYPETTLLDVNRMLTNKTFRTAVVDRITDPVVASFWKEEFAAFTDTYTREATPAIQNKIGQFVANPLVRNIIGQPKSSFDIRKIMDEKKIFLVNLSKGRIGESNAALLGSMLTVKIYLAAMSRADEPPMRMARLPRFYFFVDEFQSMMNESFAAILSESRKYKLALTLANQYVEQMEETVRDAVFGNIGTMVTFRVGPFDAETLKILFEPTFTAEDLVSLGMGQIYLSLMIDGVGSKPFSAQTIPPIETPSITYRNDIIIRSREQFARPIADVEEIIKRRQIEFVPPPPEKKKSPWDKGKSQGQGGGPRPSEAFSGGGQRQDTRPYGGGGPRSSEAYGGGGYQGSHDNYHAASRPSAASSEGGPRPSQQNEAHQQYMPPAPAHVHVSEPAAVPRPAAEPMMSHTEASGRTVRPSQPYDDPRSALRAAISTARVQQPTPSHSHNQPVRSPLDVLRERKSVSAPSTPSVLPREPMQSPASPVVAFLPAIALAKEGAKSGAVMGRSASSQMRSSLMPAHNSHDSRPTLGRSTDESGEVSSDVLRRIIKDSDKRDERV